MTLPFEEKNALKWARQFLRSLLDPKQTPRVPRAIRQQAYRVLRHYPWDMKIDKMYEGEE